MRILGVIPARYDSSRLPGKPLADIAGISMIERVYRRARLADCLERVIVATDDQRVYAAVSKFGGEVMMTQNDHVSGTMRITEVARKMPGFEAYLNIQGDEPFISKGQISLACAPLIEAFSANISRIQPAFVSTLISRCHDLSLYENPATIKAVVDLKGKALYFSRSPIPYIREVSTRENWLREHGFWKHIGIYGYSAAALEQIKDFPQGILEKTEALEQLNWLENGLEIFTRITEENSISIDTPEDLERAREYALKHD